MTTESTELVAVEPTALQTQEFSRKQINLLQKTIAAGTTPEELSLFIQVCRQKGLDPFSGQIYCVVRGQGNNRSMTIQTGIDGYRAMAEHSGQYQGQTEPMYRAKGEREWSEFWDDDDNPPYEARVGVYRLGMRDAMFATARWESYVQLKRDGEPNQFWRKFGLLMLAKCAEALALRKAFPKDLGGVYSREEMAQAGGPSNEQIEEQRALLKELQAGETAEPEVIEGSFTDSEQKEDDVEDDGELARDEQGRREAAARVVPGVDRSGADPSADAGGGPSPERQQQHAEAVDAEHKEAVDEKARDNAEEKAVQRGLPAGMATARTKVKTPNQFFAWALAAKFDIEALTRVFDVPGEAELKVRIRDIGVSAASNEVERRYIAREQEKAAAGQAEPSAGESEESEQPEEVDPGDLPF